MASTGTPYTYAPATPRGQVRLLLNDVGDDNGTAESFVFSDAEIDAFLGMEGDVVKLAAALAIDTNASNEALASKVLHTQDLTTDGAKVAAALHAQAQRLREQHAATVEAEDDGYFEVIDAGTSWPELAEHPHPGWI